MPDLIQDFMAVSADWPPSPPLFRRWSAICMVAGAIERRLWIDNGRGPIYPNLYTLLVAPPGIGKFVIEGVRKIWNNVVEPGTKSPIFNVAPDSMTKASLMDTLADSKSNRVTPDGVYTYHSLLVAAEEFSVLLPSYDPEYIGVLNSLWNNKLYHEEKRRTGRVQNLRIEMPQINLLAGAQPGWLGALFPEEAWSMGLSRRLMMIYSCEEITYDFFHAPNQDGEVYYRLMARLGEISQLYGKMEWDNNAIMRLESWHRAGRPPEPTHSKLSQYCRSRTVLAAKLAIISSISQDNNLIITLSDVDRALEWLIEAELLMPDVFRGMVGKSDTQVLEELHLYITKTYARLGNKPILTDLIWAFLAERVPSEKVSSIMLTAKMSGLMTNVAGTQDLWVPRPKDLWRPE